MKRITFKVEGQHPPRKDGAKSMWATQTSQIKALRTPAMEQMSRYDGPIRHEIRIGLRVYVHSMTDQWIADLDNFVGGVCDGLQSPPMRTEEYGSIPIIENDSQVVKISAEKIVDAGKAPSYEVEVEGI